MRTSNPERFAWLLALALIGLPRAHAADLLYVHSPSCPSCLRFQADVGRLYERTDEAQRAPLLRVEFDALEEHPLSRCLAAEVVGTPTFILVEQCQELDRIVGYSTDELFWLGLQRMLNRLPGSP